VLWFFKMFFLIFRGSTLLSLEKWEHFFFWMKIEKGWEPKRITLKNEIDNTPGKESIPVTMQHHERSSRKQPSLWSLRKSNFLAIIQNRREGIIIWSENLSDMDPFV